MTIQAMAEYLVSGYHDERKFYDQTLTYTLTGMVDEGAVYVRTALGWISEVTSLSFTEVNGPAQITGYSTGFQSFSVSNVDNGRILSSDIYVPHAFTKLSGSVEYQATVLHELLHALGFGHPGDYNGVATYADRMFHQDMRDMTVASYFGEHTPGLGVADVVALQMLYGGEIDPTTYLPENPQGLVIEAGAYANIIGTSGNDVITLID